MEYNLAEACLIMWRWKEANTQLSEAVEGKVVGGVVTLTNPVEATAVEGKPLEISRYGILTISPSLEAVRLRPPHGRRRGRVIYGSGGGGTWNLQVVLDTDDDETPKFFSEVEKGRRRMGFVFLPFRRELLASVDDDDEDDVFDGDLANLTPEDHNPQHSGSLVLTSIDPWGPGGQDPAILSVTAELDSDYNVYTAA